MVKDGGIESIRLAVLGDMGMERLVNWIVQVSPGLNSKVCYKISGVAQSVLRIKLRSVCHEISVALGALFRDRH